MASTTTTPINFNQELTNDVDSQKKKSANFRWPSRRRLISVRRRRTLPTVRLGGKKSAKKTIFRIFRRIKLRWLKLKLKKLQNYYHSLVKELIEAGGTVESFHQRLLMETSFAIPVMGVSLNSFSTRP